MPSTAVLNVIIAAESSKKTHARHGKYMNKVSIGCLRLIAVPSPTYVQTAKETETIGWEVVLYA
jgi:hypothetical protein